MEHATKMTYAQAKNRSVVTVFVKNPRLVMNKTPLN